jgi:DNA-binding NarL/FixJ family response regulator
MEPAVKLFLVEDQQLTRDAFTRALALNHRYEVIGESANPKEALANLATYEADVIILDLALSHLSSLNAVYQLREQGVKKPILIIAPNENPSDMQAAIRAGAQGCVAKTAEFSEMESAIDKLYRGETYLNQAATSSQTAFSDERAWKRPNTFEVLSKREQEIFVLLAQGRKNSEIAKTLCISTRTVDTHRSNILKKLQVKSNAELVRLAITDGVLGLG